MATTKVKGTSKKIKELKGIKPEKVTSEHLTKIQDVVQELNVTNGKIGQIETEKHVLLHKIAGLNDEMKLLQAEMQKEYGTIDINLSDGTINYPENGEVDKKD